MCPHIEVARSTFQDISSPTPGGAISLSNHANASVSDVVFDNVASDGNGGAVFLDASSIHINSSSFRRCASKVNLNQNGGNAIFADSKGSIDETLFLFESVLILCYRTIVEPGDSAILAHNMGFSRLNSLNISNNSNGYGDVVPGSCSGDMGANDGLFKISAISNNLGKRAISIWGTKHSLELCNIINNTCIYLSINNMSINNSFFYGNRLQNGSLPSIKERKRDNVIIINCWGDVKDFANSDSLPIEMNLNSFPNRKGCSVEYLKTKKLYLYVCIFSINHYR